MDALTPAQVAYRDQLDAAAIDEVALLLNCIHNHRAGHGCDGIGDEAGYGLVSMRPELHLPVIAALLRLVADHGHVEHVLAEVAA